jgi:hypothetical protein
VANRNKGRRGRSRKRRQAGGQAGAPVASVEAQALKPSRTPGEGTGDRPSAAAQRTSSGARGRRRGARGAAQHSRGGRGGGGGGGGGGGLADLRALGERPEPPWHPVPLSELLILVGAIGTVVGLNKGVSHGGPPLFAGLGAVIIGTIEVTLREHLSGYRSHTLILALLPTIALDSVALLGAAAITTPVPVAVKVAVFALDVPLFAVVFKLLRARFNEARRERVFAGQR